MRTQTVATPIAAAVRSPEALARARDRLRAMLEDMAPMRAASPETSSLSGLAGQDSDGGADPNAGWSLSLQPGLHEWFASEAEPQSRGHAPRSRDWLPPLTILIGLAQRAISKSEGRVAWVGQRCWPYPPALVTLEGDRRLLDRSIFIDPSEASGAAGAVRRNTARGVAERVWAIENAARCPGMAVVVADGAGLSMPDSRRLQLAAEASARRRGAAVLLARPPWEREELSAARTRWWITPSPPSGGDAGEGAGEADRYGRAWTVELLRCKGLGRSLRKRQGAGSGTRTRVGTGVGMARETFETAGGARRWTVRRDHVTCGIRHREDRHGEPDRWARPAEAVDGRLAPGVVDRPAQAFRTA